MSVLDINTGYFVQSLRDGMTVSGKIKKYATFTDLLAETDTSVGYAVVTDASADERISGAYSSVFYQRNGNSWDFLYKTPETDDVVVTDTTSTTPSIALEGKHHYRFTQPLTSLTITSLFNTESVKEAVIMFTTGSSFSITLPNTAKFFGARPVFNINTSYVLSYRFGAFAVGILV